jgi:phosphoribosylaminoimidazole synthetase
MTEYADAGVDIDAGNRAVELMKASVKTTRTPAVLSELGAFGGLFSTEGLGDGAVLVASTDGVGTKVELAARQGAWRSVGADLVNHCVDDILVQGARPLFFLDYIATAKLIPEVVAEIVAGMADACRTVGCALLGGETAEMPGVYTEGSVDIAGTIVGAVHRDALWPRTETMVDGDLLVGLASDSPHTNGYSLIRLLLDQHDGDHLLDWLLTPHRNYLNDVDELRAAGIEPKGLAHITGGGFFENIPRVLPDRIRAEIELGTWNVPDGFRELVRWGELSDFEAVRTWNMGIGLIAIVDASQEASVAATGHPIIGRLRSDDGPRVELVGDWR